MEVDVEGILEEVKEECITCDVIARQKDGSVCPDCRFVRGSYDKAESKGGKSRPSIPASFKEYGLDEQMAKYTLFYLLYHPELNFEIPKYIRAGHERRKDIHHRNGISFDDRPENLILTETGQHRTAHSKKEIEKYKNMEMRSSNLKEYIKELWGIN